MPTPQGTRSPYAIQGLVPNLTWDQLVSSFAAPGTDPGQYNTTATVNGLAGPTVAASRSSLAAGGDGSSAYYSTPETTTAGGDGSGPTVNAANNPGWNSWVQGLGDGTSNHFTEGPNGEVYSDNTTDDNDSWWDSTGLPLVASLAFGGATGLASAAGIGVDAAGNVIGAGTAGLGAGGTEAGYDFGQSALGSLGVDGGGGGLEAGSTLGATGEAGEGALDSTLAGGVQQLPGVTVTGAAAAPAALDLSPLLYAAPIAATALSGVNGTQSVQPPMQDVQQPQKSLTQQLQDAYNSPYRQAASGLNSAYKLFNGLTGNAGSTGSTGGTMASTGNLLPTSSTDPSILNGLLQLYGGVSTAANAKSNAQQIINTADPFNQYRQQFASDLVSNVSQPGYGNQFTPTALGNYVNSNTPQSAISPLSGFQTNPNVASSISAASQAANNPAYGALNNVGAQYDSLLTNPNSIFSDPAYKAQLAQGTDTLNRTLAARGQTASGNEMQALQDYGEANSAQYLNNRLSQLSTGYGQNLTALGQQNSALQNSATLNLNANAQAQSLAQAQAAQGLAAQNQGYTQQQGLFNSTLQGNQQDYNQQAQLSGLSQANLGLAATALSQVPGQVNAGATAAGNGLGQLNNALSGYGGIAGALGSAYNGLSGLLGGNSNNPFSLPSNAYNSDGSINSEWANSYGYNGVDSTTGLPQLSNYATPPQVDIPSPDLSNMVISGGTDGSGAGLFGDWWG